MSKKEKEQEEGRREVGVREEDESMLRCCSLLMKLQPHHSRVLAQVVLLRYQCVRRKSLEGRGGK